MAPAKGRYQSVAPSTKSKTPQDSLPAVFPDREGVHCSGAGICVLAVHQVKVKVQAGKSQVQTGKSQVGGGGRNASRDLQAGSYEEREIPSE